MSIGTIRFYDSMIISKCLHIVKKKQGLAAILIMTLRPCQMKAIIRIAEGLAAMQVLVLQEGKRPPQITAWIKTRKNYHEVKIELLQTHFSLKGEK